jgi:hypothetical protein
MRYRVFFIAILFALWLQATLSLSQQLTVQVEAGKQVVLTRAEIEALPHVKVTTSAQASLRHLRGSRLPLRWKKPESPSGRL